MPTSLSIPVLITATVALLQPPGVTPVIQGYDDVNPLAKSLTVPRADLRVPMNFDRVYRISSEVNLFGRNQEYFARAAGAMWAVFPMSSYKPTKRGMVPEIPPGTVWVIGDPVMASRTVRSSMWPTPTGPDDRVTAPLDLRLDTSVPMTQPPKPSTKQERSTAQRPEGEQPDERTIWTNEAYRQQRVSRLLDECVSP